MSVQQTILDKVPFWIKLVNLSLNCRNESAVHAIANRLGKVVEFDMDRFNGGILTYTCKGYDICHKAYMPFCSGTRWW